jgi:hypothetical protein
MISDAVSWQGAWLPSPINHRDSERMINNRRHARNLTRFARRARSLAAFALGLLVGGRLTLGFVALWFLGLFFAVRLASGHLDLTG